MKPPYLIIDFDSTFVTLESLDELARIALANHPQRDRVMAELIELTNLGMTGRIGFGESLTRRLEMFQANRDHIRELIKLLNANITPSVRRNRDFIREHADRIYIISGGFTDYIRPVVNQFGIAADHVLANSFEFNEAAQITGCDQDCLLAQDNGKPQQVALMKLDGPIYVIGDGYTDYQIKAADCADKFFAFTENVTRPNVVAVADEALASFDAVVAAATP